MLLAVVLKRKHHLTPKIPGSNIQGLVQDLAVVAAFRWIQTNAQTDFGHNSDQSLPSCDLLSKIAFILAIFDAEADLKGSDPSYLIMIKVYLKR